MAVADHDGAGTRDRVLRVPMCTTANSLNLDRHRCYAFLLLCPLLLIFRISAQTALDRDLFLHSSSPRIKCRSLCDAKIAGRVSYILRIIATAADSDGLTQALGHGIGCLFDWWADQRTHLYLLQVSTSVWRLLIGLQVSNLCLGLLT